MYVLGGILITIANLIMMIVNMYLMIVFAAVILSWIRPNPQHEIIRYILFAINKLTEPLFYQIRKRLPAFFYKTGLDFTPIVTALLIIFISQLMYSVLVDMGVSLRTDAQTSQHSLPFDARDNPFEQN